MKLNNKSRAAAAGVVTLALVASGALMASAAVQANGSDGPFYAYDTDGVLVSDPAYVFGFESDLLGSSTATDLLTPLVCDPSSTGVTTFLAPQGGERSQAAYLATAPNGFTAGTHTVLTPNVTPSGLINGNALGAKTAGGTYSLGIACTTNNGVTILGAYYRTIHMTPITGAYTLDPITADAVVDPPVVPGPQNGTVALAPTTTGAANGVLALTVPAGAAATFNAPTLVNNKSTTTGTLGNVTVNDGRVISREGWDLSATVADFKNSADATNVISKSQLGVTPKLVLAGTAATGVTAAAAQVAGAASGTYTFASGAAANTVGDSVLNADLTFVAPQDKAAGTYTSTMTLTVVSK